MLYGLSVSFCIKDLIEGKVAYEDIECIIAGTAVRNEDDLVKLAEVYEETYWRNDPELGHDYLWRLWEDGKIFQPRLFYGNEFAPMIAEGHWVLSAEDAWDTIFVDEAFDRLFFNEER
jgi:hypothetical protein